MRVPGTASQRNHYYSVRLRRWKVALGAPMLCLFLTAAFTGASYGQDNAPAQPDVQPKQELKSSQGADVKVKDGAKKEVKPLVDGGAKPEHPKPEPKTAPVAEVKAKDAPKKEVAPANEAKAGPRPNESRTGVPDYVIGSEDVLEIAVWKNAELTKVVNVRPDGKISLPLIGDVAAAGLTPVELHDAIVSRLKEYQDTAIVSVIVNSVNSYRIFMLGEVKTPGTYQLKTKTTVIQAIALAGGFTQYASRNKMVIIRKSPDGRGVRIPVPFDDIVQSDESTDKNLYLLPGDTIFVP